MKIQELIEYLEKEISIRRKNGALYRRQGLTTLWELENAKLKAYMEILNKINESSEGS